MGAVAPFVPVRFGCRNARPFDFGVVFIFSIKQSFPVSAWYLLTSIPVQPTRGPSVAIGQPRKKATTEKDPQEQSRTHGREARAHTKKRKEVLTTRG